MADWYPDRQVRASYRPMMGDYRNLQGDEIDEAFLQDMIPHQMAEIHEMDDWLRDFADE